MTSWLIGIIAGGIVGWLTVYAMNPDRRGNVAANIIMGAIGGVFGIWFFFLGLGIITASATANFWLAILWAVIGSLVIVAIVNAIAASMSKSEGAYERRTSKGYPHEYEEIEVRRRRKDNNNLDDEL